MLRLAQLSNSLALEGCFSAASMAAMATKEAFCSIFRDLQDFSSFAPLESQMKNLHSFAPLESQVENCLEKNLPENPKEKNETTRPHGKVENVETIWDKWNSA